MTGSDFTTFFEQIRQVPDQDVSFLAPSGVRLYVRRYDLMDFYWGGNKIFKLRYFLEAFFKQGATQLLTYGGAYSNHIAATAAMCEALGIPAIGVIRGDGFDDQNPTLVFAKARGMHLHFVNRGDYRSKDTAVFKAVLQNRFGDFYNIPEGGSGLLGVQGAAEMIKTKDEAYTHFVTASGTGTTLSGLARGVNKRQEVIGIPVFKDGGFLGQVVQDQAAGTSGRVNIWSGYGFGGYAKWTSDLLGFLSETHKKAGLPLDPVYTGKAFFGLIDQLSRGYFTRGCKILFIHTGGLQGAQTLRKG
jgi:1-aminocyclopropane-1-carboxylate deaminase